jgi:hypothetical protein
MRRSLRVGRPTQRSGVRLIAREHLGDVIDLLLPQPRVTCVVRPPVVAASLSLHGECYVFFFTVSQVHVDNVASDEIRHSAQSLLTLITLGIGNPIGSYFTGFVRDFFTTGEAEAMVTNWQGVFLVPVFITVCCAVAFLLFFKEPPMGEKIA